MGERFSVTYKICLSFLLLLTLVSGVVQADLTVTQLRCEYEENPLGIDAVKPRLSWIITGESRGILQSAYQILVASSQKNLDADKADLWDSGKVKSDQSIQILYAGKTLTSGMKCYWKVRIWDQDGKASTYGQSSSWQMGLLSPEDWHGKWIAPASINPSVIKEWKCKYNNIAPNPAPECALANFDDSDWLVLKDNTEDPLKEKKGYAWYRTTIKITKNENDQLLPRNLIFPHVVNNIWVFANGELVKSNVNLREDGETSNFVVSTFAGFKEGVNSIAVCIECTRVHEHHPGGLRNAVRLSSPPNLFRKSFALDKKVAQAYVYVSGLGGYDFFLNGQEVTGSVLAPDFTVYKDRIQYQTFDVTELLREGKNAVGVVVGNGISLGRSPYLSNASRQTIMQMNIEFVDGSKKSIVSDDSWKCISGPIIVDHLFGGEKYDALAEVSNWAGSELDDSDWLPMVISAHAPKGQLVSHQCEPIKVTQTVPAVKMSEPKEGTYIFDLGQNIAGWAKLKVQGPTGTEVVLRFGELLNKDGLVHTPVLGLTDTYTLKGEGVEIWEPRFTYHGFRYVEMTGYPGEPAPDAIEGRVVRSAVPRAGEFACSNQLINNIQSLITWSLRDNFHSFPTDCCNRGERSAWGGDAQVMAATACYNFDLRRFYGKWLNDFKDDQREDGGIYDCTPWTGWGGFGAPGWHDCYFVIAWNMYQSYGDTQVIEEQFDGMQRALSFILNSNPNLIWENNVGGNYADWGSPVTDKEHKSLLNTCNFYRAALFMSRMADAIGRKEEAKSYSELSSRISEALQKRFFNAETASYAGGAQAANAFPLFLGIVPKAYESKVVANLVADIVKNEYHLTTGPQGTRYVMQALEMYGQSEIAYKLATQTTKPSWGYMIANDATTLWEFWGGGPHMSQNHPFLGSVGEWFYEGLAGIGTNSNYPAYEKIIIKPDVVGDLTWAKASVKTIRGLVASDWEIQGDMLTLKVIVPGNSTADVYVPKLAMKNVVVKEGGKIVWHNGAQVKDIPGITAAKETAEYVRFETGSGSYRYEIADAAIADAN
ncbi:MAG: family 78 glycoside hydrolase catalytic domain [Bythopirellula sp.]